MGIILRNSFSLFVSRVRHTAVVYFNIVFVADFVKSIMTGKVFGHYLEEFFFFICFHVYIKCRVKPRDISSTHLFFLSVFCFVPNISLVTTVMLRFIVRRWRFSNSSVDEERLENRSLIMVEICFLINSDFTNCYFNVVNGCCAERL